MTLSRSSGESGSFVAPERVREPRPQALEGLRQPYRVDRLEDVVDCVDRERVNRVLVERRHEYELRRRVGEEQAPSNFESGESRHLDIEKHDIRFDLARQPECADAVGRLAGDFDATRLAEEEAQLLASQLFIVHDERANIRHRLSGGSAIGRLHLRDFYPGLRALSGLADQLELIRRAIDDAQAFVDIAQADAGL